MQLPLITKEKQTRDDFFLFLSVQELDGVKLCTTLNKKFLRLFSAFEPKSLIEQD